MMKSGPRLPQLEKALAQKQRPNTAKKYIYIYINNLWDYKHFPTFKKLSSLSKSTVNTNFFQIAYLILLNLKKLSIQQTVAGISTQCAYVCAHACGFFFLN